MIVETNWSVSPELYQTCVENAIISDGKLTINKPTGRFFYDPWIIKEEYQNTVWEQVLNTLPNSIGEARLITLQPGTCYFSHADIDDRYHLTLTGRKSYLIDLETDSMHSLSQDGLWYDMNAGLIHSAVNFGDIPRIQLVVRKLLTEVTGYPSKLLTVSLNTDIHDSRYYFDKEISPLLNRGCKSGIVNSFSVDGNKVSFRIHPSFAQEILDKSCDRYTVTSIEDNG